MINKNIKSIVLAVSVLFMTLCLILSVCVFKNSSQGVGDLSFLPLEFSLSGNGAWNYTFTVNSDGTFEGKYTDWNADTGEDYAGMYHICEFSGKFKDIKVNDDYSYSLTLAKFESKYKDGEEWIEDGTKYIATDSLEDFAVGRKFLLYKSDIPLDKLETEVLIDWPYRYDENDGTLSCYTLYSPSYNGSCSRSFFSKRIFNVSESQVLNTYNKLMNNFYDHTPGFYYTTQDIDGNGVKELIIKVNTAITVYTYEYGIKQLDSYDFVTGTVRMFASESPKYRGIFSFTVGGSCDHYSYITLNNGCLDKTKLCEYYFSADEPYWNDISDDKEIIAEAKLLYNENRDIEFVEFKPTVSAENSVTFVNSSITYTATVVFDEENVAKNLIVTNNDTGEIIQENEISKFENFADKPIYAVDVTFDGNLDLLIPCERPASAIYFSAYIYDASHSDAKENNFVYAPSFQEIPNFALDKQNEMILSRRTQSMITSYCMSWYSFGDHDFLLASSLYYEPANLRDSSYSEDEIYFVEKSYASDEKETIVNEFVAASDGVIDPDKTDPKVAPYYENGSFWDLDSDKWDSIFTADDILSKFTLVPTQNPLTLGEVKAVFEPLLEKAVSVEQTIMNDAGTFEYEKDVAFTQNDCDYHLITDKDFQSVYDVWNYAYTAFTIEAAERTFSDRLDQNSDCPRFLEKGGKLYYNTNAHGYNSRFDMDSLKIINQFENAVIISINKYLPGDDETPSEKLIFIMVNTQNGWRFANTETESNDIDASRYTQSAIVRSNNANTALNAFVDFLNGKTYAKDTSPNRPSKSPLYILITNLDNRNLQSGIDGYTFFDMNDDNIPEMITEGYNMAVFAYKNGEVQMIYESPAGSSSQKCLLANKKIYWSLTSTGTSYEIASFDKDLNVTVDTYFDGKTEQEGDEESFYHNENKITESEFYKLKSEFFAPHFFKSPDTTWIAYNAAKNTTTAKRNMGEMQLETTEFIEINGQMYQSYVAANVDIRYIWINESEFSGGDMWGWFTVGTKSLYSLDLLGKVNEGRR